MVAMNENYPKLGPVSETPYPASYDQESASAPQWNPPMSEQAIPVEDVPPVWFQVCKYYVVILNSVELGVLVLLASIIGFVALLGLFTGEIAQFVLLLLLTGILCLFMLYFWKIPIQGALNENIKYLIIHGVVCIIFLPQILTGYTPSIGAEDRRHAIHDVADNAFLRLLRFLFWAAEVGSCFLMAHTIQKRMTNQNMSMA